jgi:hypothetical protein
MLAPQPRVTENRPIAGPLNGQGTATIFVEVCQGNGLRSAERTQRMKDVPKRRKWSCA